MRNQKVDGNQFFDTAVLTQSFGYGGLGAFHLYLFVLQKVI